MNAPILITGGTGTLGGHVAPRLLAAGAELRILSRTQREAEEGIEYVVGDLAADRGIDDAVAGVRTVVHLAGGAKGDEVLAGHLVRAAKEAGVAHVVFISVTAADRIRSPTCGRSTRPSRCWPSRASRTRCSVPRSSTTWC